MSHWSQVLQERAASGLSVQDYCLSKGITKNTYFYWQKKLREAACEQLALAQANTTGLPVRNFAEVRVSGGPMPPTSVQHNQICIDTGSFKITAGAGYPMENLAMLLREVARSC